MTEHEGQISFLSFFRNKTVEKPSFHMPVSSPMMARLLVS